MAGRTRTRRALLAVKARVFRNLFERYSGNPRKANGSSLFPDLFLLRIFVALEQDEDDRGHQRHQHPAQHSQREAEAMAIGDGVRGGIGARILLVCGGAADALVPLGSVKLIR